MELNRETVINQMQEWSDGICKNACLKGEYLNGKIVACETCFPNTVRNALALIKELTEDNEYLKTQLTATEARAESRKESDLEEVLGLRLRVEELTEESKNFEQAYDCMHSACRELSSECDRLTEEVADWKAIAEQYQKQFEDCAEDRAKLTVENERLRAENVDCKLGFSLLEDAFQRLEKINNQIEAETVRKMQEKLRDGHLTATNPNVICLYESELDQIAKEMVEGINEQ